MAGAACLIGATLTSANGGGVTIGLSGNGVADVGSLNATSVVSTGTYSFGVSGGSVVDAAGLAGSLTLTPAWLIVGGSLALTDLPPARSSDRRTGP
jgi:hypothetical protein